MSLQTLKTDRLLNPSVWQTMVSQAQVLVESGLLPNSIRKAEQAVAIMMKGYELGIPPMQAFSHINVISGKPTISSELMLALIYRVYPQAQIDFDLGDDYCTISASRPGDAKSTIFTFQRSDAEKAGLLSRDNWKKYPRAMYKARCISEMARTKFADAIMGCGYTPEELDPEVKLNEEGEIIEIKPIEPLKKIFDKNNEGAVDWLKKKMTAEGISGEDQKHIIEELHGKDYLTEYAPLIAQIK